MLVVMTMRDKNALYASGLWARPADFISSSSVFPSSILFMSVQAFATWPVPFLSLDLALAISFFRPMPQHLSLHCLHSVRYWARRFLFCAVTQFWSHVEVKMLSHHCSEKRTIIWGVLVRQTSSRMQCILQMLSCFHCTFAEVTFSLEKKRNLRKGFCYFTSIHPAAFRNFLNQIKAPFIKPKS